MIDITPIKGAAHGANVWGLNLNDPCTEDLIKTLADALYEYRVLIIKNQQLNKSRYLEFGKWWGEPIPHVLDHMRMPEYPELLAVGNTEQKDKSDEIRNGAALWHTDQSYESIPASATMLYSILVPIQGGQTKLADMTAAYDALDNDMKHKIDALEVAHLYGAGKLLDEEFRANPLTTSDQVARIPSCYHPLVMKHPVTGRKSLYATGQSCFGIKGMDDDEAIKLLWTLKMHAIQDQFVYSHTYEVGDIAMFDTLSTMHSAVPIEQADENRPETKRLLWRISVRGVPKIYENLTKAL
ncbi:MAG: hypothetical protein CMM58_05770 [Rhodospirillaceae bacterium]|nr:hypothetical protein [Rhodospirillaceae bacterium]|tara:strand:+ start:1147 stop:2037 length:891 start_codon:yes stop_codon:yes gene_type:complete